MDRDKFRHIVEKHLVPLFSGAILLDDFEESSSSQKTVSWRDPCSFYIKPRKDADYRCVLTRTQEFAKTASGGVTEHKVVVAFIEALQEIAESIGSLAEQDLLSHLARRVAVKAICQRANHEPMVLATIDQFDTWSTRLYEGQPITAAVGFSSSPRPPGVSLGDIWEKDFSPVLTNGFDTLLSSDFEGRIKGYRSLKIPEPEELPLYAPHRLSLIAFWTAQHPARIAIVLNRTGEILVIQNGRLVFTRRGGVWHFLTHEPVITQMRCPQDKDVRKAVYASCLDASFARTGACIGIMTSGDVHRLGKVAPEKGDHIQTGISVKSRLINKIVRGKAFQYLDRRLRQELLAIDGATILDYQGKLLAVGAILHIDGGSSGGGRLAAAIELGKYGTGIKVSQDGGIRGYYRCKDQETARPAFVVM